MDGWMDVYYGPDAAPNEESEANAGGHHQQHQPLHQRRQGLRRLQCSAPAPAPRDCAPSLVMSHESCHQAPTDLVPGEGPGSRSEGPGGPHHRPAAQGGPGGVQGVQGGCSAGHLGVQWRPV
jgi:hypothetical protein